MILAVLNKILNKIYKIHFDISVVAANLQNEWQLLQPPQIYEDEKENCF